MDKVYVIVAPPYPSNVTLTFVGASGGGGLVPTTNVHSDVMALVKESVAA
jgi:hypothetical protein